MRAIKKDLEASLGRVATRDEWAAELGLDDATELNARLLPLEVGFVGEAYLGVFLFCASATFLWRVFGTPRCSKRATNFDAV